MRLVCGLGPPHSLPAPLRVFGTPQEDRKTRTPLAMRLVRGLGPPYSLPAPLRVFGTPQKDRKTRLD